MIVSDDFKKLNPTYRELHQVMDNFGFSRRVEKSKDEVKEKLLGKPRYFIGYFDKKGKLFYPIIQRSDEEIVALRNLLHISIQLHDFGFTDSYDDLVKLIEKNRQAAQKAAAA